MSDNVKIRFALARLFDLMGDIDNDIAKSATSRANRTRSTTQRARDQLTAINRELREKGLG